jgi:hypothetical protein
MLTRWVCAVTRVQQHSDLVTEESRNRRRRKKVLARGNAAAWKLFESCVTLRRMEVPDCPEPNRNQNVVAQSTRCGGGSGNQQPSRRPSISPARDKTVSCDFSRDSLVILPLSCPRLCQLVQEDQMFEKEQYGLSYLISN